MERMHQVSATSSRIEPHTTFLSFPHWSMATTLATKLVLDALDMALWQRRPKDDPSFRTKAHSIPRSPSATAAGRQGVRPSMGSVGDAYDNAMAESFFATLECELLERRRFKTHAEAKMAIFEFIESFHNLRRRHPALGYLSPADFERRYSVGSDLKASEHEE